MGLCVPILKILWGMILLAVVKIYLNKELECHVWTCDKVKLKVYIFSIFFSLFVHRADDG